MPEITFHVLSDPAPDAHLRYTCRLAEQLVDNGQRVFIRASSADEAKRIDDLLWTFGDRSFLPHEIATSESPTHPMVKVLIGTAEIPGDFDPAMINLSSSLPPELAALKRVIELVPADAARKRAARERFKQYRERGIAPATQNV